MSREPIWHQGIQRVMPLTTGERATLAAREFPVKPGDLITIDDVTYLTVHIEHFQDGYKHIVLERLRSVQPNLHMDWKAEGFPYPPDTDVKIEKKKPARMIRLDD